MTRRKIDPLRVLTDQEREALTRISRSASEPASQVARAKALLAVADGLNYQEAALVAGRAMPWRNSSSAQPPATLCLRWLWGLHGPPRPAAQQCSREMATLMPSDPLAVQIGEVEFAWFRWLLYRLLGGGRLDRDFLCGRHTTCIESGRVIVISSGSSNRLRSVSNISLIRYLQSIVPTNNCPPYWS
jgi:hypothetical protein